MADAGLFIGFGAPVRGREAKGLDVFGEAIAYYGGLQESGVIESFDTVLLEAHGGDLNGFFLLRGDEERLAQLRIDEEFGRLLTRATLVVDGIGVVGAVLGDGLQDAIGTYGEAISELA